MYEPTKQNSQQAYEKVLNDISHQKNEIKTSLRYTYCRRAKIKKKKKDIDNIKY